MYIWLHVHVYMYNYTYTHVYSVLASMFVTTMSDLNSEIAVWSETEACYWGVKVSYCWLVCTHQEDALHVICFIAKACILLIIAWLLCRLLHTCTCTCTYIPVFLISLYGAPLAQRASDLALHSALFGPLAQLIMIILSLTASTLC